MKNKLLVLHPFASDDDNMAFLLVLLLIGALTSIGIGVLVRAGLRSGDRPNDSRVHITSTWTRQPDGWVSAAHVTIDNQPAPAAVVAISTRPARRWSRVTPGASVSTPRLSRRPRPLTGGDHTTILAVAGTRSAADIALAVSSTARAWVTVVVYQPEGRTRVWRSCLPVLPTTAPPAGATTPSGDRAGR
jgi:hypothetical protein